METDSHYALTSLQVDSMKLAPVEDKQRKPLYIAFFFLGLKGCYRIIQ